MNKWMNGWMNEKWMNEYNAEWVEVRKMSEDFRGKLYCKMSDFFASLLALRLSTRKSEINRYTSNKKFLIIHFLVKILGLP